MELVRGALAAANWPGNRALSATEFEAARAWEDVLDEVAALDAAGTLDAVARSVPFATALRALEVQARDARFTPPSTDAPVKVMSVAEAEGSFFDAAVLLGATDANWPEAARAHPLLSWAMQRTLRMPGSHPAQTTAESRARIEALLAATGPVLCTHAEEDASGALRPSPLLEDLGIKPVEAGDLELCAYSTPRVPCETVVDEGALPPLPSSEVSGGASVLKLQAACGFLAFAELRLRSRAPEGRDLGLDAGESGTLLHRALQTFWRETKSQEKLRSMSAEQREEAIARAVESALPSSLHLALKVRNAWDRAYLSIQRQRLRFLLRQWLPHELNRGPFTVADVERKELVEVGPLTLDVRVDRIDSVAGGVFLVDYKTGFQVGQKQWEGPRPDEPQLPLYALLAEAEELRGMAFGRLRAGKEMGWVGYQSEEGILPTLRSKANVKDMAALAAEWRRTLDRLAREFAEGNAQVDPKSYEKNCAGCAQRLLCRVDPSAAAERSDDAEEEEEILG